MYKTQLYILTFCSFSPANIIQTKNIFINLLMQANSISSKMNSMVEMHN